MWDKPMELTKPQKLVNDRLDAIAALLKALGEHLEQERADLGNADWAAAGELGYIAEKLAEVDAFWTGGE
jgi:hypothetical protein